MYHVNNMLLLYYKYKESNKNSMYKYNIKPACMTHLMSALVDSTRESRN